jgi:fructokinase
MRVGIDLGGTKIEALVLDPRGEQLERVRVATPTTYGQTLDAITELVTSVERRHGPVPALGVGMPGTVDRRTGLVKNSNRLFMNGKPFEEDLKARLRRPVRCANDANCFAASEAVDGAGRGEHVVFGVIVGTGCGGGIAIDGRALDGAAGGAGEWGHNPLPWPAPEENPGPPCSCGQSGCMETWVSGPGFANDHARHTGQNLTPKEIADRAARGAEDARASLERYVSRLARGLATLVNVLDPDVIVLGGGMSNVDVLYEELPELVARWVFGGSGRIAIRKAVHGDSSGVRGAARLFGP